MATKVYLLVVLVSCVSAVDYSGDSPRSSSSSNYATPTPYSPEPTSSYGYQASAEAKSGHGYKDDDRRPYSEGNSHSRTGPPKKLGPLSYSGHNVPINYPALGPHRFYPHGQVVGYLAYPPPQIFGQQIHGGYALPHSGLHDSPLSVAHGSPILPSAAFSHIAYASPIAFPHYHPKPIPLGTGPLSSGGPPLHSSPHSSY